MLQQCYCIKIFPWPSPVKQRKNKNTLHPAHPTPTPTPYLHLPGSGVLRSTTQDDGDRKEVVQLQCVRGPPSEGTVRGYLCSVHKFPLTVPSPGGPLTTHYSAISKGRTYVRSRIEPAALWSQGLAAHSTVTSFIHFFMITFTFQLNS